MSIDQDKHSMVSAIKDLAIEMGKTPTQPEFQEKCGFTRHQIVKVFGSYTVLLQAADLEKGSRKITQAVFDTDIERHLEQYKERERTQPIEPFSRCLFIPDTHFPFVHNRTLEKIYKFADDHKPEVIVQLGDLYDAYSHAKFPRSHNNFTPREEYRSSREQAEKMWQTIASVCPQAKLYQICGNHDARPLKRILEVYPEAEDWVKKMFAEMMSFPGVETILDTRQELVLPGDVMVLHGYKSKLGEHRDHMLFNAVCGHQHTGGVVFKNLRGRTLWELNAGLCGDPEAKGLTYTPQRITSWTLGFGWLDEYGPRFIPA